MKGIILWIAAWMISSGSFAEGDRDISVHDPVMIEANDKYYLFCTGWGITVFSSDDMTEWKKEPSVFSQAPAWAVETVPDFKGHIWAPDISFHDGRYYLYYSVSSFAKNTSAIGLVTNVTLDPNSPDYEWIDQGKIVQSVPYRDMWNAIDPNLIEDEKGEPWMAFGSFWDGMKMVKLSSDRTSLAQPEQWRTIAKRKRSDELDDRLPGDGAIEAPFIFKKDKFYYLFVSWDYCCRGENSTYKVVVGRSENATGPYLDQEGIDLNQGGGTLVVEGNERWAGVGHNSTYTFNGKDYLAFHGYDMKDEGHPKLIIKQLNWTNDNWPVQVEVSNQ